MARGLGRVGRQRVGRERVELVDAQTDGGGGGGGQRRRRGEGRESRELAERSGEPELRSDAQGALGLQAGDEPGVDCVA